jgi:hypothetical protein
MRSQSFGALIQGIKFTISPFGETPETDLTRLQGEKDYGRMVLHRKPPEVEVHGMVLSGPRNSIRVMPFFCALLFLQHVLFKIYLKPIKMLQYQTSPVMRYDYLMWQFGTLLVNYHR